MTALDVYLHADRVGSLVRLPQARLSFTYGSTWVNGGGVPLSLALPVRAESFDDAECRPFFAGLLPEGEFLRAIGRAFHVSADNAFGVLAEIGGECAGAVSLVTPGQEPPAASAAPPSWLDREAIGRLIANLPSRPLLVGLDADDEGVRLSLAGARDKLPVLARDSELGITRGRPPSTHIVKVPIADVEGMVANEAFCLALATEVGLAAAKATPIEVAGHEVLLVTRYDRSPQGDSVHRIHQEDFCQALGYLPEEKYEADGGPSVAACGHLLRSVSAAPAIDLLAFLDALTFNLLIGNADAHSKNYSLLLEGDGAPRLAPLYDLLSTRVYGHRFGRKMAMKYGGEYRSDRIRRRHLERLAADLEISKATVLVRAGDLAHGAISACEAARSQLPEKWQGAGIVDRVEAVVRQAAERLLLTVVESV